MRAPRCGVTLVSSVIAMAIISGCLVLTIQGYLQGSRVVALQARRAQASAACQQHIETARASGYRALPAAGEYPFRVADEREPRGRLVVAMGPLNDTREVTARVSWPAEERLAAGSAELTTILSARGVSP